MSDACSIHVTIVDGRGNQIPDNTQLLIRLLNGAREIPAKWSHGGDITVTDLEFTDTGRDAYHVFVKPTGFHETVSPNRVELIPGDTAEVALMAIPDHAQFQFLKWDQFSTRDDSIVRLISNGADDPAARYATTAENCNRPFGALLAMAQAIRDTPLKDGGHPLDCYWRVMWDQLAPDRFWAWVDAKLVGRVAESPHFAPELGVAALHPGIPGVDDATRSWKDTTFDVANVQLTFHETTRQTIDGVDCVVAEPDIDLYKDFLAHGLLEVLPNALTGGKTNPLAVYPMRWMATRQNPGVPPFTPPVWIE
jgi:hypothetical protein